MNKLSFRARALEGWKPMPIYMSEELPDLPKYSAINRAVPQMPSGMNKEEECEHHLQRAIVTGLIIPIPEVTRLEGQDLEDYNRLYPPNYKVPRQLIHMQPFAMEQDIPNYDMDSEDEAWVNARAKTLGITPLKFEEIMDRLEENSTHSVITPSEAKMLLKEDEHVMAVYDYWLNKRLKTQQSLIPTVKTEAHRTGNSSYNPYVAFQRRMEKMQTRKNRKNDEASYEKMVKLRRDFQRALTLLELVKKRENTKRDLLKLTIDIFEKRYQAGDWSGQMLTEVAALKNSRPVFAPLFSNQFGVNQTANWANKQLKDDLLGRKEKRHYKKRKHKNSTSAFGIADGNDMLSSGDEDGNFSTHLPLSPTSSIEEPMFTFRRSKFASYHPPLNNGMKPSYPTEEDKISARSQFNPVLIKTPHSKSLVSARRRFGRGGRILLDRGLPPGSHDDFWEACGFKIQDRSSSSLPSPGTVINTEGMKVFRAKTPPRNVLQSTPALEELSEHSGTSGETHLVLQVEDLSNPDVSPMQVEMSDLFPGMGACEGNPLESDLTLLLELPFNNSSSSSNNKSNLNTETSNHKDLSDNGFIDTFENKPIKLEPSTNNLPADLVSVDLKDLIGSPGILFDLLSHNSDPTNTVPQVKKEKLDNGSNCNANAGCDISDNKNNVTKVISNDRLENSGSLLDRWAKFESGPDVNQTTKRNVRLSVDNFVGDDSVGHSAFKVLNS